jgi:hypothetical protein
MLKKASPLHCDVGDEKDFMLTFLELSGFKELDFLRKDSFIARDTDILRRNIGKPKQIIRNPGADAGTARRVPPVLHIAFPKLAAGS